MRERRWGGDEGPFDAYEIAYTELANIKGRGQVIPIDIKKGPRRGRRQPQNRKGRPRDGFGS